MDDPAQWSFTRLIGGSKQETLATMEADRVTLEQTQEFRVMENEALEVVTEPKDAVADVTTKATTKGWVKFDRTQGGITASELRTNSRSSVVDRASGKQTSRELVSVMKCSSRT